MSVSLLFFCLICLNIFCRCCRFVNFDYFCNMQNIHIFERYPLLPVALFLIIGILSGVGLVGIVAQALWIVMLVVSVLFAVFAVRFRIMQTVLILVSVFFLGCFLGNRAEQGKHAELADETLYYKGVVKSEPKVHGKTIRFDVLLTEGKLAGRSVRLSVLRDTIGGNYKSLKLNCGIAFKTSLKEPSNFTDSNFDYADYLLNHGIIAQGFVYYDNWKLEKPDLQHLSLMDRAQLNAHVVRRNILDNLKVNIFEEDVFAIIAAMVMGDKSALTKEMRNTYSLTGASHVLALSGLHLGIIYAFLSFVSFRRRYKYFGSTLLICAIWAYAFLVGMMPSVVRAALMLSIMTFVGLSGRAPLSLNVLSFAAIVMLLVKPLNIYDVGFQLSFLAVAFIVSFHKHVNPLVPVDYQQRHRLVRWLWQLALVSFLAQMGTMPIVAYYFGNIPLLALISNFVVIPCTTVILYLSVALVLFGFVPLLGQAIGFMLSFVVSAQNGFLAMLSALPYASIQDVDINMMQVVVSYSIIVCLLLASIIAIKHKCQKSDGRYWV